VTAPTFAEELRRLRIAAGLSIGGLAERAHYSKSHLSKIERGEKRPNAEIARRCDAALGSGRALSSLLEAGTGARSTGPGPAYGEALPTSDGAALPMLLTSGWLTRVNPDGSGQFVAPGHESVGSPEMLPWGPVATAGGPVVELLSGTLLGLRAAARSTSPAVLFPTLTGVLQAIRVEAANATHTRRESLTRLLGSGAELAGWLAQEMGDDRMSAWWTDQATKIAELVGDDDLWAYTLIRKSLMALYRHDHALAIGLASTATSRLGTSLRTRWLAEQRVAQGHALAGDPAASLRAVDRVVDLLPPVADQAKTDNNLTELVLGWCLYELGFLDRAIEIFDAEVPRIASGATRSMARFAVRQALAHTAVGNVERACGIVTRIVEDVVLVDSATIRSDLHVLSHGLRRWSHRPAVASIKLRVAAATVGRLYP
jgi:DNA-binding XRE family transcriptional regulator